MALHSRQSSRQKSGVWTHRYNAGDVKKALERATEQDRPYFRSGGRLDASTADTPRASK